MKTKKYNKSLKKYAELEKTEKIKIFGNCHNKPILNGFELDNKWDKILLSEFDYLCNDEILESNNNNEILESIKENFNGFVYKNQLYSLDQFMNLHNSIYSQNENLKKYFDGYLNFTYFSGLLIKLDDIGEFLQVFYYYSIG